MNLADTVKTSNSWHWLYATIAVAAVVSVFMPTYGWLDVLKYERHVLVTNEKRAQDSLDKQKELCGVEISEVESETRAAKADAAKARTEFAKYGMEELPVGGDAVFVAQRRVSEALNRRKLQVVSAEARVAVKESAEKRSSAPKAVPKKKEMTPEEVIANAEKAAAKMKDRKMAEMVLNDARKTAAKLKKEKERRPGMPTVKARNADQQVSATAGWVQPPFKTDTIEYKVSGDFRDMFMFFVAETHKKPYYTFKDIVVEHGDAGMELAFKLVVGHR